MAFIRGKRRRPDLGFAVNRRWGMTGSAARARGVPHADIMKYMDRVPLRLPTKSTDLYDISLEKTIDFLDQLARLSVRERR